MHSRRPNILWIVTTQWRAQACGYAGDPNARTPRVDALAAASLNFTQAVTPHPFGPFARAAMLTGVASPANGVGDYFDPLPATAWTVAHRLRERGYRTAFFGKWHLGPRDPAAPLVGEAHARIVVPPEGRGGFEFWEGFESGFLLNDPWLHGSRLAEPQRFSGYQSDVLCDRAGEWLRKSSTNGVMRPGGPPSLFAVVSLEAPHPPYHEPAGGVMAREARLIELAPNVPRGGAIEAKARRELAGYYAHIEATDAAIGRLVAPLERRPDSRTSVAAAAPADETNDRPWVVVFTSVHGDMHGAHGYFRKGWPYEESVRVPLLVRGGAFREPGAAAPATQGVCTAAVSLLDLPAMTEAWAEGGAACVDHQHSLISMPTVVALPQQCDRPWAGVRTTARKMIFNPDGSPWMLFDLEHDALETRNLAHEAGRVEEINALRRLAFAAGPG